MDHLHRPMNIRLDLSSERVLSPLLFGDNLEHTRDCVNSGLSAQMLKNRKFVALPDRYGCAMHWYRIGRNAGFTYSIPRAYTRHHEGYFMKRSHERYAQVITAYGADTVGPIGQKELFLTGGREYSFAVVASVHAPIAVTVALVGSDGKRLAGCDILMENTEHTRYEATLIPARSDPSASLEITFRGPGALILGAVSFMPKDNFRGMRRDVIGKMKELGIRLLRWPGGNFSGEYYWKDGLLPRDQRAPFQSYLRLETQPHSLGYDFHEISTDDFLALCEEIGAEPFITINPTWSTPEDSGQWVEYCNGDISTPYGALRARNGHEAPYNVKRWSLGNEFGYGHMEGANGPREYAASIRKHAEKMLEADPELILCSSGPYPNQEWAEHSALALEPVAPVVSLHHYGPYGEFIDPALREQDYYTSILCPDTEFLPRMRALREQLGDRLTISQDEWNIWAAWYRPGSVTEGIFAARFLNMLYMNAEKYGISQACHFESVNEGSLLVEPDRVIMTPTGQAIAAMRDHAGARICALEDDVVATQKDGVLTCTLINRSYDKAKTFHMPKLGMTLSAMLLWGEGVVTGTRFREEALPLREEGDSLTATLPEHSIAILKLRLP